MASAADPKLLSDKELYDLCQTYGANARMWRNKFGSLLPEVMRRELYLRHGFCSIYEFAAKVGGMSRESVSEVLRVSKLLEDKPILQSQLQTFGWSKLRVVATVSTPETDKMWAEKVEMLPKNSLETYVKGIKAQCVNSLPGEAIAKPVESFVSLSFKIDSETEFKLRKFKLKLEKEKKQAMTFNEVLKELMDRAEKVELQKERPCEKRKIRERREPIPDQPASRHIPAQTKKELDAKYDGRCAFPNCNRPESELHHAERWALTKNHEHIAPLCEEHHKIAHAGLIENERMTPCDWRLADMPDEYAKNYQIDKKFQEWAAAKRGG